MAEFEFLLVSLLVDNTAGIVTKRSGFRRRLQEIYFLPVVIEDNGYPPKSSTGTLTIRVCGCESDGSLLTCGAEAIFLPVGLSTGALIAILLCIIILLGESSCLLDCKHSSFWHRVINNHEGHSDHNTSNHTKITSHLGSSNWYNMPMLGSIN